MWGAVILLTILIVAAGAAAAPTIALKTSGSTTGRPKTLDHRWSLVEIGWLQFLYARAMGLRPRHLASMMTIILQPKRATTPEGSAWGRSMLSAWTSRSARWQLYHHDAPTSHARAIDRRRPRAVVLLASAASQLTRLREVHGLPGWTPEVLVLIGEGSSAAEWARTQRAWAPARVEQQYGATECPLIAMRDAASGLYRPAGGTAVRPDPAGIMVRGFPARRWIRIEDPVVFRGGGAFEIVGARGRAIAPLVAAGHALQESGRVACFQVQRTGDAYTIAFVALAGGATPGEVRRHFARVLPAGARVDAREGESAWRQPRMHVSKHAGFVCLD